MSNLTAIIPSSIPLNGDAAIASILTNIPLFCQGIMGMGVFTFLFIIKRVKIISVFLYGSSFLAFAAATLDLGQILARGPQATARDISLQNITALLFGREILLALSLSFLNIFFWMLVAACPLDEYNHPTDTMSTISRQSIHSASWSRWGTVGTILKWFSLLALLSAPLLQAFWRLIPSQRRYSTLYVTESIIQTSISLIFTLKLFLNIYLSTLPTWWHAFRRYIPTFLALTFGASIGIVNLLIFSFSETILGRFLRTVEVYILIIQSLHTTFLFERKHFDSSSQPPVLVFPMEKMTGLLFPMEEAKLVYDRQARARMENNIFLNRIPQRNSPRTPVFPTTKVPAPAIDRTPMTSQRPINDVTASSAPSFVAPLTRAFEKYDGRPSRSLRQSSGIDISYYMDSKPINTQSSTQPVGGNMEPKRQSSVSSLDRLLLQSKEMDNSIAALRMESGQPQVLSDDTYSITVERSQSTIGRSDIARTDSISGRSDFSLSVFPEPPTLTTNGAATAYVVLDSPIQSSPQHSRNISSTSNQVTTKTDNVKAGYASGVALEGEKRRGIGDLDVTSFIGRATEASKPHGGLSITDNTSSEDDRSTSSAPTAVIGSAITLRPMILASALIMSPIDRGSLPLPSIPPNASGHRSSSSGSGSDISASGLRPLLLGKPISSIPPIKAGTVPLAQRRQRGRTISNARRPLIISNPTLKEEAVVGSNPGAFERPRPPPLRLS